MFFCALIFSNYLPELDSASEDDDDDEDSFDDTGTGTAVGIFETAFICSRSSSVSPPRPMDVKKLIANLVFFGLSRGNIPENDSCNVLKNKRKNTVNFFDSFKVICITYASFNRSFNFDKPMYSQSSWNNILMNILLELVVSSSFNLIISNTSQLIASVNKRCAKNLLTFLSLFVSNL